MAKKRKHKNQKTTEKKKEFNWKLLIITVSAIILSCLVYFSLIEISGAYQIIFKITFLVYSVLLVGFILTYVYINKGFTDRGITEDMLSDAMSAEQKRAYVEDVRNREKSTKWMLIVILALAIPLAVDLFRLYVWDSFSDSFGSMFDLFVDAVS